MKLLEDKILNDGVILPGNVLNVDSFLSQKIDAPFVEKLAEEWKRLFIEENITKIVTIESSGIGIACIAALKFGVPVVYARKIRSSSVSSDAYSAKVVSYTHGTSYDVTIPKMHLSDSDTILIIDDFLANGSALKALIKICEKAGSKIAGVGIAIEKSYQGGADKLREQGYRIESLAKIKKMDDVNGIEFC